METTLSEKMNVSQLAGKYLTFRLGDESYGISVLKVREIMRHTNTTVVPQMPDYIKGVINLRGKIIPVVDLRLKFGMPGSDTTEHSCIVVVHVARTDNTKLTMGIVVDGVEEVANIAAGDIEETPDFGVQMEDTAYILGMAKIKGVVKALLDIDKVLTAETVEMVASCA
jgi:purine-binding chemotaxis protein CheW